MFIIMLFKHPTKVTVSHYITYKSKLTITIIYFIHLFHLNLPLIPVTFELIDD